jgi:hypothetical protein
LGWSGVDGIGGDTRVTLLTAVESKGLEFDSLVVGEPAGIVAEHPAIGLNLLYVAMTRAVMHLTLVHAQPLPPELTDGLPRRAGVSDGGTVASVEHRGHL